MGGMIMRDPEKEQLMKDLYTGKVSSKSEPVPVRPESAGWVNPWKQPCRTCVNLTTFDGSLFCRIREDFTNGSTTGCGDWEKCNDVKPNRGIDGKSPLND
jgi:hypothetical protein